MKLLATGSGELRVTVAGNPEVLNRRKYRRLPMKNTYRAKIADVEKTFQGRMINISAGGFAFTTEEKEIENKIGSFVSVTVDGLDTVEKGKLEGTIIRITKDGNRYHLGCRMHEDSKEIYDYVEKNFRE